MNTDLRNIVASLMQVCDIIRDTLPASDPRREIKNQTVSDILSFIEAISANGAQQRKEQFLEDYLDGSWTVIYKDQEGKPIPKSLRWFCSVDSEAFTGEKIKTADLFIAALSEIGLSYLRSGLEGNSINSAKFTTRIRCMNSYAAAMRIEGKNTASTDGKGIVNSKRPDSSETLPTEEKNVSQEESLEELLDQLNKLIGLAGVKQEVTTLTNMLRINKIREERGFKSPSVSKHLVFLGNPGTGKTTVARLLSKIYKQLGVLETGQLVEVDRGDLVAGYVGQTALKTKEKIDEAMGGILFIDEAYTLAKSGTDFGQESIDTILKAMEDNRENFVVIVAGYPEPMEDFLNSNPGLKSRFNKSIVFEDYTQGELMDIFNLFCDSYGLHLSEDGKQFLTEYLDHLCANKPENFANGREMRNLFEKELAKQANRLARLVEVSDSALMEITKEDLS